MSARSCADRGDLLARLVTIVTGPLVGLRTHEFLDATEMLAKTLGREVRVFHLFDEILRLHRPKAKQYVERVFQIGELLANYDYYFEEIRRSAYLEIARQIDRLPPGTHAIVRAPASVEWREINLEFKDHRVIAAALQPDRIVTLIDAEWKIQQRLAAGSSHAAYRLIAQQERLTLTRILGWLGAEVSRSEDWAEWCREKTAKEVPHHVLGVACPSLTDRSRFVPDLDGMVKLATERNLPTFYASYSMTVAGKRERDEINRAIARLRRHGLVIDPGSIEIEDGSLDPADHVAVFAYTVFRDLRWDVKKVDVVAAFHPYKNNPPLSTGMMDELGHARAYNTDRYLVLPVGGGSPFTAGTYVPKNHVFTNTEDFFEFLEKRRRPQLPRRFDAIVDAFVKATRPPRGQRSGGSKKAGAREPKQAGRRPKVHKRAGGRKRG